MIDKDLIEAGYRYEGMRHDIHTYIFTNAEGIKVTIEVPEKCMQLTIPVKIPTSDEVPVNAKDRVNQDYTTEMFERDAAAIQKVMDKASKAQEQAAKSEQARNEADANRLFEEANKVETKKPPTKPMSKLQARKAAKAAKAAKVARKTANV